MNKLTPTTPQQQCFWHQDANNEFVVQPTTPLSSQSFTQNGYFNKIYCNFCKGQYIALNGGDFIQCFCGVKPRSCLQSIENPQNFNINCNKAEDVKMVKVYQSNGTNSMQTVPLKEFRRMIGLKDHRRNNSLNSASEINQQQSNRNIPANFNNNNNNYNRTFSVQHQQMIVQPQYNNSQKSLPIFNSNRPIQQQQQQQTRWQQPISFINSSINLNNQATNSLNNKPMNFKYYQQPLQHQQLPTPQHIFEMNQNLIKNDQQQQQYNQFQAPQQFGYNGVSFELRQLIPPQNNLDVQQTLQIQQQQQQSYNLNDNFNYYPIQRYNQIQQQPDTQNLSSSSSSSSSSTSSASSTIQQQQVQQLNHNNSNIENNQFTPTTLYVPISQQPIQSQANFPNMILSSLNDEIKYEFF